MNTEHIDTDQLIADLEEAREHVDPAEVHEAIGAHAGQCLGTVSEVLGQAVATHGLAALVDLLADSHYELYQAVRAPEPL